LFQTYFETTPRVLSQVVTDRPVIDHQFLKFLVWKFTILPKSYQKQISVSHKWFKILTASHNATIMQWQYIER